VVDGWQVPTPCCRTRLAVQARLDYDHRRQAGVTGLRAGRLSGLRRARGGCRNGRNRRPRRRTVGMRMGFGLIDHGAWAAALAGLTIDHHGLAGLAIRAARPRRCHRPASQSNTAQHKPSCPIEHAQAHPHRCPGMAQGHRYCRNLAGVQRISRTRSLSNCIITPFTARQATLQASVLKRSNACHAHHQRDNSVPQALQITERGSFPFPGRESDAPTRRYRAIPPDTHRGFDVPNVQTSCSNPSLMLQTCCSPENPALDPRQPREYP